MARNRVGRRSLISLSFANKQRGFAARPTTAEDIRIYGEVPLATLPRRQSCPFATECLVCLFGGLSRIECKPSGTHVWVVFFFSFGADRLSSDLPIKIDRRQGMHNSFRLCVAVGPSIFANGHRGLHRDKKQHQSRLLRPPGCSQPLTGTSVGKPTRVAASRASAASSLRLESRECERVTVSHHRSTCRQA